MEESEINEKEKFLNEQDKKDKEAENKFEKMKAAHSNITSQLQVQNNDTGQFSSTLETNSYFQQSGIAGQTGSLGQSQVFQQNTFKKFENTLTIPSNIDASKPISNARRRQYHKMRAESSGGVGLEYSLQSQGQGQG